MIRPETVKMMIEMTPSQLCTVLDFSGYPGCKFTEVSFQGITESGDFRYTVKYLEDGLVEIGRVYVTYDHATSMLSAIF
jgi:hypothetical protein